MADRAAGRAGLKINGRVRLKVLGPQHTVGPTGPGSRTPGFTPGYFGPAHNFHRGLSPVLARSPNMFRGGHEEVFGRLAWEGPQTGHPRRGR